MGGKKIVIWGFLAFFVASLFSMTLPVSDAQAAGWLWSAPTAFSFCQTSPSFNICAQYNNGGDPGLTDSTFTLHESKLIWNDADKLAMCKFVHSYDDYDTTYKPECDPVLAAASSGSGGGTTIKATGEIWGLYDDPDPDGALMDDTAGNSSIGLSAINSKDNQINFWYKRIKSGDATVGADPAFITARKGIIDELNFAGPNIQNIVNGFRSNLRNLALFYGQLTDPEPFSGDVTNPPSPIVPTNPLYQTTSDGKIMLGAQKISDNMVGKSQGNNPWNGAQNCVQAGVDLYNCFQTRWKWTRTMGAWLYKIIVVTNYGTGGENASMADWASKANLKLNPDTIHKLVRTDVNKFDLKDAGEDDGDLYASLRQLFDDPYVVELLTGSPPAWLKVKYAAQYSNLNQDSIKNPCGTTPGGLEIGKAISMAFCNIVDLIHSGVNEFLAGSATLLGKMTNIDATKVKIVNGAYKTYTVGFGSLLIHSVPEGLQGANILRTLDTPLVINMAGYIRTLLGVVVILMFLLVAFSNILQININTYAIKKIVPGLVIGYIVAYFGVFAVRAGVEIANTASTVFLTETLNKGSASKQITDCYGSGMSMQYLVMGLTNVEVTNDCTEKNAMLRDVGATEPNMGLVIRQAIMNIFIFVAGVMVFILAFLFVLRGVIFIGLACIAPLGLFSAFVPPLSFVWQKWSKTLGGWLFMNVVAIFWIWLATQFYMAGTSDSTKLIGPLSTGIIGYAMGLFCVYMAMKTPFSMAGEASQILNKWNSMGKSVWGRTGGTALKAGWRNTKAASGLIPGVAGTKKWYADQKHETERRNKMWTEGLTQRGANKVRENEERIQNETKKLEEEFKTLNKDRDRVLNDPNLKLRRDTLKKTEKAIDEGEGLFAGMTADERKAEKTRLREAYKTHEDAALSAGGATSISSREADLVAKEMKLKSDTINNTGVGRAGKKFLKLAQQDAVYAARHKEHEGRVAVATEAAARELKSSESAAAHQYQHYIDDAKDSSLYAESAKSTGNYHEADRYISGNKAHAHSLGERQAAADTAAFRRDFKTRSSTLNKLNEKEAEMASFMGALDNYTEGKPRKYAGESDDQYKLRLSIWNDNETQIKAASRQTADRQKVNPSFGATKYDYHGKAAMKKVSYRQIFIDNPDETQTLDMQIDMVNDRFKAAGNMAGGYNFFTVTGNDKQGHAPVKAREAYDAADMFIRYGAEGEEKQALEEIREQARGLRDKATGFTSPDEIKQAETIIKERMKDFVNQKDKYGEEGIAYQAELLNRDPYRSVFFH